MKQNENNSTDVKSSKTHSVVYHFRSSLKYNKESAKLLSTVSARGSMFGYQRFLEPCLLPRYTSVHVAPGDKCCEVRGSTTRKTDFFSIRSKAHCSAVHLKLHPKRTTRKYWSVMQLALWDLETSATKRMLSGNKPKFILTSSFTRSTYISRQL